MRPTVTRVITAAVAAAAMGAHASLQQPAQQVPGAIRSRITLVPLDVRVVGRDGKPVIDLTQADFTILEDGKPQEVGHFELQTLSPDPLAASGARVEMRRPGDSEAAAAQRRVFLIVLGRGRLDVVGKGVTAAMEFIRTRALPQDLIAIQAYNRATPFTTDRSVIIATLERFQKAHGRIEARLCGKGGLAALYGAPEDLVARAQKDIDAIFGGAGSAGVRSAMPADPQTRQAATGITRNAYDAAQILLDSTSHLHYATPNPEEGGPERLKEIIEAERALNDFTSRNSRALADVSALYTAVDYLRFIRGEKHIVYLTEFGILLPGTDDDMGLARAAADARVAVHPIQTGGYAMGRVSVCDEAAPRDPVRASRPAGFGGPLRSVLDEARGSSDVRTSGMVPSFAAGSLRTFAEITGGRASTFRYASEAFERIDAATRAGYVLGYYPANGNWSGRFRRVEVRVNRPGVTVHHRFGYYGRDQLVPSDERKFTAYTRIAAAASYTRPISDIGLSVVASLVGDSDAPAVDVKGTVDVTSLALRREAGRRTGTLQVVVFCGDAREELVGERWQTIDLNLSDETYQKALAQGVTYATRLPVKAMPRHVKVIVYDQAADRLGSASAAIPERIR